MKKKIIILITIILSGISFTQAQSAGDIDTQSQWRVNFSHDFPPYGSAYYYYKHYISGSVIVDSLEYYKVYRSGYSYADPSNPSYFNDVYSGAVREHENKWYKLEYNNEDVLLYDFTMEIGDTVYPFNQGLIITVIDIDTILIDGSPKKRFQLDHAGWGYGEEYIIEDVGATTGLFEELLFFEWESDLLCYAIDFVPLWLNPDNPYCDLSVSIEENDNKPTIFTYPNPFTTSTTIEYELKEISNIQYTVYNIQGVVVYEWEENEALPGTHKVIWSPNHLPSGMYYGVLRSDEGVSVVKMVKQ